MRTRGLGKTATSFAAVTVLGLASAGPLWAQGESHLERAMLRQRVGVDRAESLLLATTFDERLRGIDRLAALGTDEAVKALAGGMSPGTAVRSDPRTRLAAVRALAPHAEKHVQARRVLVSVLNSVRAGSPETPLDVMSRATAAIALARVGSESTITTLLAAVAARGRTGELATDALLAFPPADLGPLARSSKDMSRAVITLLGDLGDPRVLGLLRRQLKRKTPAIQQAAAVSLAKLGDGTPADLALAWGKKGKDKDAQEPLRRVAGAEVLMWLDAPKAPTAIAHLLGDARTRAAGLSLAEASLSPALVPTLQAVVEAKVTPGERARAVTILAKIGGDAAAPVLLGLLARPELTTTAAFGLASASGEVAASGLAQALAAAAPGAPRRLILRAGLVRHLKLDERVAGLSRALAEAFASNDAADRAVGAFGLALLGEREVADLVTSKHPEVVLAAARAALGLGPSALSALGERLAKAPPVEPTTTTIALSAALLVGGHGLGTDRLLEWAEGGSSLAPLAAFQLARRDSTAFRERLVPLLEGTDPIVRLHVALGLAESPEADAVALLTDAYRFETDARVRRAIVRALSVRGEKRREATLAEAAFIDPDAEVRALARAAKSGRKLDLVRVPSGREVAWVSLRANSEAEKKSVSSRALALVREDGLALPLVSAPDGVILVPGVGDRHRLSVLLAAEE